MKAKTKLVILKGKDGSIRLEKQVPVKRKGLPSGLQIFKSIPVEHELLTER